MQNAYQSYQATSIGTSDRGKLVIMIYDHCLKWCKLALQHFEAREPEKAYKAVFKVQDGITELTCALDLEKGGEIAKNLLNLYTFYNRHLSMVLRSNEIKPVQQVQDMLATLRGAWVEAVDKVRREDRSTIQDVQRSSVQMVG